MIDPATGWFEMKPIQTKKADNIANIVEQTWLTRYPKPEMVTFDRGTEFMREFAKMLTEDYGIKKKPHHHTKSTSQRDYRASAPNNW